MPERPKTASVFIKVLVAVHVIAITSYSLPRPAKAVMDGKAPPYGTDAFLKWNDQVVKPLPFVTPYLRASGFWQFWDMFSPNPATIDMWGDAVITYQDGSTRRWQYPRMYLLPLQEKYLQERFRKYYERASQDSFRYLWPTFAQRVARLTDVQPGNPPVQVELIRHWQVLPKPGNPIPTEYQKYTYYVHPVDQADLDKERKRHE